MGRGAHASGKFIATDITSIAINTTIVNGTDYSALVVKVWDLGTIIIQGKCTGGVAACALPVQYNFVGSPDGLNWDTVTFYQLEVTLNGVTEARYSQHVNVLGFFAIRLQSIKNTETVATRTAVVVNARWGKSYGGAQF